MYINQEKLNDYLEKIKVEGKEEFVKKCNELDPYLKLILNQWLEDRTYPSFELMGYSLYELTEYHNYNIFDTLFFINKTINLPLEEAEKEILKIKK